MIEPAILERLAGLLGVAAAELQVRPLPGGLSNRGCLLSRGNDWWAVRLPLAAGSRKATGAGKADSTDRTAYSGGAAHSEEASCSEDALRASDVSQASDTSRASEAFCASEDSDNGEASHSGETLSLKSETQVLAAAAEAKLTPELIACDAETGALVTRYLRDATSLSAERTRDHANIDRIGAMLRRLHNLPAPTGLRAFRPTELARIHVDAADESTGAPRESMVERQYADERRRWSVEFRHLAQTYEAAFKPTTLCHNDLVAANILDDGRLWLVDFEYAVRADPILDLAGLAGLNGFGPAHCHRLLDAYYGPGRAPISSAQLEQTIRLVRLMAFFWALAHGGGDANDGQASFAAAMAAVLR